jgi:hypothetical protein
MAEVHKTGDDWTMGMAQLVLLAGAVDPDMHKGVRAQIADKPDTVPDWVRKHPAYVDARRKIREARGV